MSYADLKKWFILNLLDDSICRNIRMAIVCDIPNNEALIVTKDEKVYALAISESSYSGCKNPSIDLVEIESLRNQKLKTIAYGTDGHILALTKNRRVYAWGEISQNKSSLKYKTPILLTDIVHEKLIVDIACGPNHSLAIASDGSVYTWGKDVASNESIVLGQAKCVAISIDCGPSCNLVVVENGDCYYWRNDESSTTKLNISTPLQKVVCASDHFLALNDKGHLYVGDYKRTKNGECTCNFNYSSQLIFQMGFIIDIAAHHSSNVSAAINREQKVFILCGCNTGYIGFPYCTPFTNLHDVFALCTVKRIMHRPLILDSVQEPVNILECIKTAFNDPETSDLVVKVDEKSIYVHKSFLRMRSIFFKAKFKEIWTNSDPSVMEYDLFNYDVYKSFFNYLYTGKVDVQAEHVLDLWRAGDLYMEPALCQLCVNIVKETVTVENAVALYVQAQDYNCEDVKIICLEFTLDHMSDVILSPDFQNVNEAVARDLVITVMKLGALET